MSLLVMLNMSLRQLRDAERLKSWLRAGKTVELLEREDVIARIVPLRAAEGHKYPDFAARRKRIFGNRVLPGAGLVIEERGRY